jgi:hypothetical protein
MKVAITIDTKLLFAALVMISLLAVVAYRVVASPSGC